MLNSVSARYLGWRYSTLHARLHHLKSRVTQTNIGILTVHSKKQIAPVVSFRNSQGELVRGTITDLQRRSVVMEIYNPYSIVQVSEILSDLTVKAGVVDVYRGRAVVTSMVSTGLTAVVSVTLADEWRELSTLHGSPHSFREEAQLFVTDWERRSRVHNGFQIAVNDMRAFLAEVSRWVGQVDLTADMAPGKEALPEEAFYELADPIIDRIAVHMDNFESEAAAVPVELAHVHRGYAQAALHPLLMRSPFLHRTYTKPLGYAGDYEMVNQIINNPRQGPNTYAQIVNVAFLKTGVAAAHRNRIRILIDFLKGLARQAAQEGRVFRVMNIGCGPAMEIRRFLQECDESHYLEFVLVDFNGETINFAKDKIDDVAQQKGVPAHVRFIQQSVHELIKKKEKNSLNDDEKCDAIYCAGLFDYLTDKVCSRLLAYFAAHLKNGGKVLVTNVHEKNAQRLAMEHLLEWYLIYRDESQLEKLVRSQFAENKEYTDETGVNVFSEARLVQ